MIDENKHIYKNYKIYLVIPNKKQVLKKVKKQEKKIAFLRYSIILYTANHTQILHLDAIYSSCKIAMLVRECYYNLVIILVY